ncbi:MAG: DUF1566 domain-containing protein [Deltaproteobacteria bacterium]|nr:DUF1566 domain-containing protein [Deltaproteobacteria bacterium]
MLRQKIITTLVTLAALLCCLSAMSESQTTPAPVPKTGQTLSYATGDDGDLQKGEASGSATATFTYPVVDTGQTKCYNAASEIAAPGSGQAFYGQDAQFSHNQPSYTLSSDGLTVYDNVTGLTWQSSPDTNGDGAITSTDKMTYAQAISRPATLNAAKYGGYSDWRLPTIKELYSLIDFRGTDPSGYTGTDTSGLTPFINTGYFKFAYGQLSAGERIIDSQYASSNLYVGPSPGGSKLFGVNFADGRIKGYDLQMSGNPEKTFFVQCVRGNTSYGVNNFLDNGDQTITDKATGLMWSKSDSGSAMNWEAALAWVQTKNAANYLGRNDWRLPNAKELQSIVDYTRCPDTTGSAAIDPVFTSTSITNEGGQVDYPYYWTGTTHAAYDGSGGAGVYVSFGRALGWMKQINSTCYTLSDVHGAGAQRSDPKSGSPTSYYLGLACSGGSAYGHGPQGDIIRVYNSVRLVRNIMQTDYDFNGDGKADILWHHADTGQVWLYLMNGMFISSNGPVATVNDLNWTIQGIGDFNGDGKTDILWRNITTKQVWIYLMNGTSIVSQGLVGTVSDSNWQIQGVGDFDGDGKADILWRNAVTGQVWMYLMNGTSISSQGSVGTVSDLNWKIEGIGDFNGDGKADILWRNTNTGQVWMWTMNGSTITSQGSVGTVSDLSWQIQGIGDFNGDGKSDVLWRNSATGQVWMYLMNGVSIASQGYVGAVSDSNWQIQGVGDFDGDGKADTLWRNATTGEVWLYLMNVTAIASQGSVAIVSDSNWKTQLLFGR